MGVRDFVTIGMHTQSNYQIYSTSKDAWDAMYQAILTAKKSIYWELYIFLDDEAGNPFFDLLEKKALQGLDIKVVVDSLGSFWLSSRRIDSLKKAGVDIRFFHEGKYRFRGWLRRFWSRTHRKILIVDETVGFIGGVNIKKGMEDWWDIQVRFDGAVVHSLLRAFAKSYVICGGEKKLVKHLYKYKTRVLHDEAELVFDHGGENRSNARKKYTEGLIKARERVILFSPYYYPDKKFLLALWQARKRGVKVDLLIPFRSDIRFTTYISYAMFSLMKTFGVNIYFSEGMMHGKGMIVDDDWAMVGSSNMDKTSFYDNYEANIHIKRKDIVKNLKDIVEKWLTLSSKFEELRWKQRGFWQKTKEWWAKRLYNWWHGDK